MQNGQEILLSITIADDDMIWHVHMFPEVMFMDTIANTNRQKRDLFLMVVKDAPGDTPSMRPIVDVYQTSSVFLLSVI